MRHGSPSVLLGLAGGFAFFAHAMINNSHAWPLIWPLLAGAASVAMAARAHRLGSFWSGIGLAAKSGLIAGVLFFVTTAAALWMLSQGQLGGLIDTNGTSIDVGGNVLLGLAFAAAIGTVLAIAAGAVAYPLSRRRA